MDSHYANIKDRQKLVLELMKKVDWICRKNNIPYSLAYGSVLGAVRHKGFIPWDIDMDITIPITYVSKFRKIVKKELPPNMRIYEWDKERKYSPCFDRISYVNIKHEQCCIDIFPLCGVPDNKRLRDFFLIKCYLYYIFFNNKNKDIRFAKKRNVWKIKIIKCFLSLVPDSVIRKGYNKLKLKYDYDTHKNVSTLVTRYRNHDYTEKDKLLDVMSVPFEDAYFFIPKNYDEYLKHIYGDYMTPIKYE